MSYAKTQRRKKLLAQLRADKPPATQVLSEAALLQIRDLGLLISHTPDFVPDHVAYPNGYLVSKPVGVPGNSIAGYECHLEDNRGCEVVSDAPSPVIYSNDLGGWSVAVHQWVPGPGPGDFEISFADEQSAIEEVIRYLLGPRNDS